MKDLGKSEIRDRTTQETDTTVSMPKSERSHPKIGGFGFRNSFVIRHSSFVIVSAFTLIELLIVIAIIGILAALIFPITGAVTRARVKSVATTELSQMETAIESYKAKTGSYPPDCIAPGTTPASPIYLAQLYYELLGASVDNAGVVYKTLDGSSQIDTGTLSSKFGVGGIVNSTKGAGGDEGAVATPFLTGLKPGQIGQLDKVPGVYQPRILVCSVPWPKDNPYQPVPSTLALPGLNPWRYISSNPTNNPSSFDLWVDVIINGKTNRISNWSPPKLVATP